MAAQDPVDGSSRYAELGAEPVLTTAVVDPGGNDPGLDVGEVRESASVCGRDDRS